LKPSPFAYAKPADLAEALRLKADHGDDGTFIAGGQSLVATLNMRLSSPEILIDIGGVSELSGIEISDGRVRIGALTRHRDLEDSAQIKAHAPLIAEAITQVAHPAIRNRGTMGGSIAFADPAAELPACILALDGAIEIAGPDGRRKVAAGDFFKGLYDTDLGAGEIITAAEFSADSKDWRTGFDELARRHGDYAMAGLAARLRMDGEAVAEARLVYFAVGDKPVLAAAAGGAITGKPLAPETIEAAAASLDGDLEPFDDLHSSAAMKLHLARELTRRVLTKIARGAQ
jgi:carbon-monoxide dehydrogenase medium subunit